MVVVLALTGCASMSDSQRTKTEGTLVGAGTGALLGAVIGGVVGGRDGALIGAAIGTAAGGAAGYAYGTHVANQKEQYASREDWLNDCIAQAERVNDETRQVNESLAAEISQLDSETQSLADAYNRKQAKSEALALEKQKIDTRLAEANKQLDKARFEVQQQEKVVSDARSGGQTREAEALDAKIRDLKTCVSELEGHTRSLASMSARMAV